MRKPCFYRVSKTFWGLGSSLGTDIPTEVGKYFPVIVVSLNIINKLV